MLNDLRYCLRTLMKSPGLAAVAILSLGLGIGLNLTVFGVFESMFIRGVTAADPEHTFHDGATAEPARDPGRRRCGHRLRALAEPSDARVAGLAG